MRFEPHPYQRAALKWIMEHDRCCLFLEMGLGKTVVSLTAASRLMELMDVERLLIVAPKKVAEATWTAECSQWDHLSGLGVQACVGTAKQREKVLGSEPRAMVVSRDNLQWLAGAYGKGRRAWPWDMIVIDELTSFKNHSASRTKVMRAMSKLATRVVGLTGTPAPNGYVDLWSQLMCVDQGESLGRSFTAYRDRFFSVYRMNNVVIRCTPKPGAVDEIKSLLAPRCLTMQAADYLSMPAIVEEDMPVEIGSRARALYAELEREQVLELKGSDAPITAASAAALCNKLAQFANGFVYDEDGAPHRVHDAKLAALAETYEQAQAQGSGLLVFCQYREDAAAILSAFKGSREYKGKADLEAWNSGAVPLMVAHPAATAYGLNMQAGGCCIAWFGTGWNMELYLQANARLHRQGQTRPVCVRRLVASGTIDERMSAAITGKKTAQQALMDGLKALMEKYG